MGDAKRRKNLNPTTYGKSPEYLLLIPQRVYDYALAQTTPGVVRITFIKDSSSQRSGKIVDVDLSFISFDSIIDKSSRMRDSGVANNEAIDKGIAFALESKSNCDWSINRVICIDNKSMNTVAIENIIPTVKQVLRITD
jgi:hypothetical protein